MKHIQPQTLFGIVAAALIVLGGGYLIYSDIKTFSPDTVEEVASETEKEISDTDGVEGTGEIETPTAGQEISGDSFLNTQPTSPQPDLDRPIVVYDTDLPAEVQETYRGYIRTLTNELKSDPNVFANWLDLGIIRKAIGDYEAARTIWTYAGELRPNSNIPFLNLGDLYHYYLKDFPKAEASFRTAITNSPSYMQTYVMLHELYKYSYKQQTAAAVNVLQEGLAVSPDDVNLLETLARYYAEKGDTSNARVYYEKARDAATQQGDTARAALLQEELDRL